MNVSRPGMHLEHGASAAYLGVDRFPRLLHAPLYRHRDWCVNIERAGTGGKIGLKSGVARQPPMHVAGACPNLPKAVLRPFGGDVSPAGPAAKCAIKATGRDVSRSGMQVNVAGASLLQLDV